MTDNVHWHHHKITREEREKQLKQKSFLLWFTGLSGSGKSTVAMDLQEKLHSMGKLSYVLDGDNIRHGLNSNLGFSADDRSENIRRIGEVGKLFVDAGFITIACFISPYKKDRDKVREKLGEDFIEVYIECDVDRCEQRDPKGLYKKARAGEIKNFTGISAPYEAPENPEIKINTGCTEVGACSDMVIDKLKKKGLL